MPKEVSLTYHDRRNHLREQVLPVGGIKEKVLAAKRAGLKKIIMCWQNEKDVERNKQAVH